MFEKVILVVVGVAALVIGTRAIRGRRSPRFGDGLGFRSLTTSLFSEPSPDGSEPYTPDTGALTRQILKAMRSLGHASITHSARALAPHLHVEGVQADINAIIDFQGAILADIEAYVAANGRRWRWTLTEKPTLTHSIVDDGTPGVLRITRARPPRGPQPPGRGGTITRIGPAPTGTGGPGLRATLKVAPTPPVTADFDAASAATRGMRSGATRRLIPDSAGTAAPASAGDMRLFRVGGGNVYRLAAGVNVAGRDPARCDIVLGFDDAVSAVHAEVVVLDDGNVTVRDLGSSNGTALAGKPVTGGAARLAHGDVLTIGTTGLRFVNGNAPLVPTAKMAGHE